MEREEKRVLPCLVVSWRDEGEVMIECEDGEKRKRGCVCVLNK